MRGTRCHEFVPMQANTIVGTLCCGKAYTLDAAWESGRLTPLFGRFAAGRLTPLDAATLAKCRLLCELVEQRLTQTLAETRTLAERLTHDALTPVQRFTVL